MNDDNDHASVINPEDHMVSGPIARWIPMVVVSTALAGFVWLAWYAYQAGTQSLNDNALMVVEADSTPIKEKPEDPGGMQFPNQDKIIFETFAGDSKEPPKVERVLPAPEEPMPVTADAGTTTWVNNKIHDTSAPTAEAPLSAKEASGKEIEIKEEFVREAAVDKQQDKDGTDTIKSFKQEKAPEAKKAETVLESAVKSPKATGPVKAQLGAYGSEKEAKSAWAGMLKKHKELSGRDYIVAKADLGAKGIFYRLRVIGFADTATAKSFCSALAAKGQACIPVAQ